MAVVKAGVFIDVDEGTGLILVGKGEEGTVCITCQCELIKISKKGEKDWKVPSGRDKAWTIRIYKNQEEVESPLKNVSRFLAVNRGKQMCDELFPKLLYRPSYPGRKNERLI